MIVSGKKYWAIDYDNASNDDPLLDLAVAGLTHGYTLEENRRLLSFYLKHPITPQDQQKFDLYRQLAILFYSTEMLSHLQADGWTLDLEGQQIPPLSILLSRMRSGTFSLDDQANVFLLGISGIQDVVK